MEPGEPILDGARCETWGNLMMLEQRPEGQASWKLPTYYGAQLLTKEFFGAADGEHMLYPVHIGAPKDQPPTLAAYAVRRPDDLWALLVLNKDPARTQTVSALFESGGSAQSNWVGPHVIVQYSPVPVSMESKQGRRPTCVFEPSSREPNRERQAAFRGLAADVDHGHPRSARQGNGSENRSCKLTGRL